MKKKILLLACSLALILSCMASGVASAATDFADVPKGTKEDRIISIINELGIMVGYDEEGVRTFKPDQAVTRAEFVTVVRNCINYWDSIGDGDDGDSSGFNWIQYYLGSTDTELEPMYPSGSGSEETATVTRLWSDVDESHWAYAYMRDMAFLGTIHGYPDGTFRPENNVSYDEAVKIILSLCGYDEYAQSTGGFPDGYTKLAGRFNLNKGITTLGSNPISRMEVATLVYNSFTLPLTSPLLADGEERNFLNDVIGVYLIEGTLESTDITSIYGGDSNSANTAVVNDTEITFDANSNIRDYIGQELRIFAREVDDKYVMTYFEPTEKEDTTVIDISLLEGYEDNTISYRKSEESSAVKKVEFRKGSKLIYNGKYTSYTADTFDKANLNKGTVTVIEKDDYDFDIIVIENLESGYLSNVNSKLLKLTDGLKSQTSGGAAIKLESDDANETVFYQIFDAEGNSLTIDDLSIGGAINYYQNDGMVKIYYSQNTISGSVSGSKIEDDVTYITIDGEEYVISKAYLDAKGNNITGGMKIKGVTDMFGEIVWMEVESSTLDGWAYIIKVRQDIENDTLIIKYYDLAQKQVVEAVTASDYVKFTDSNNITGKYNISNLYDALNGYDSLVKLTISDSKITRVALALAKSTDYEGTDKLKLMLETNEDSTSTYYKNNYRYYGDGGFAGKYFINANTLLLNIPNDRTDTDKYTISQVSSLTGNGTTHVVKLYTFDEESPYMNVMLKYSAGDSTTSKFHNVANYLVLARRESINVDGELTTELDLYNISTGETSVVESAQDDVGKSLFERAYDAFMQKNNRTVERGDLIQLARENTWSGDVVAARIVYDANGVNPAWCCNDATNMPTSCTKGHTPSVIGTICGSTGFNVHEKFYENPVAYTWGNASGYDAFPGHREAYQSYILGFIHSEKEDMIRITTQNLKDNFKEEDDNFYWTYWKPSSANVIIYEDGVITKGNVDDIRSYAEYGNKCDKVLFYAYYGVMQTMIIIRD